jgi:hypothetical protein
MMAALAAASVAQAAAAADAPLNDGPAAGDNLRVYTFLGTSKVTLAVDGVSSTVDGRSVMFTQVKPGAHTATLTEPDGSRASLDFTLSAEAQIESKGRRWWCLSTGRRDGRLTMLLLTQAQCKAIADAGPD